MARNQAESKSRELKRLGFVRVATIQTLIVVSNLYEFAKQNSGPLRSTVGTVEGTVTSVLGPVYNKFKDVPDDVLVFVDTKADEAEKRTRTYREHAPSFAKKVASQARELVQKVAHEAGRIASEAQCGGPRAAIRYVTTGTKHLLLASSVKLWTSLNHYQPFHAAAEMVVPTAARCSEKYNHVIKHMAGKGYAVFGYLPLIPIDDIAKAFKQGKEKKSE